MKNPGYLKKSLMALGLLLMVITGYGATSVVTSCDAEAAMCHCSICVYATGGVTMALGQILSGILYPSITAAAGYVIAYLALAFAAFIAQMTEKFFTVVQNLVSWFDSLWTYNLKPAMQAQTRQLNTMDTDQVRAWAGSADVQDLGRVRRELYSMEAESVAEHTPGENVCNAATVVGGMTRATSFQRAYNAAAPVEMVKRSGGAVGTPAQHGKAADQKARWDNYVTLYCDKDANNGTAGCAANGTRVGQDIDVTGQIFQKDTIDLTDDDVRKTIDDLITNIAEPFTLDHVPGSAANSVIAQERVLEQEAYKAKRQTIYDALYHVVARRAPGTNMDAFIRPMRTAAGVNNADISRNPSKNEVMEVMMSERFRTGQYSVQQVDEPRNNDRELVIQQAFQVMQLSDQLDLLDRYSMMLAGEIGEEIHEAKPFDSKGAAAAPVK